MNRSNIYTEDSYDFRNDYDYDEYLTGSTVDDDDEYFTRYSRKVNRNYIYDRNSKKQKTDWNDCVPSELMMYKIIPAYIKKHIGQPFNKVFHEFCNTKKFSDKYNWKLYGEYWTPKTYFKHCFDKEKYRSYPEFYIDEDGLIQESKQEIRRVKRNKDIKYNYSESYYVWDMNMVEKYFDELCVLFSFKYVDSITSDICLSNEKGYNLIKKIDKIKIINRDYTPSKYFSISSYCSEPQYRQYLCGRDFIKSVQSYNVIKYGSKEYNSAKKQIEANKRQKEREEREQRMSQIAFDLNKAQQKRIKSGGNYWELYFESINKSFNK